MSTSASLSRDDIVITVFPFTDLSGSKRRPTVIYIAERATVEAIQRDAQRFVERIDEYLQQAGAL